MNIEKIISEMTLKEKCALLVGADSWHTTAIPRLGVPSIMMADGPHGLRKQLESGNNIEIQESYKAVCFPAEATIAASFDPELAYKMGKGIAEECLNKDVHALLGPGLNIKRSPLCGRNFEYYSEDPLLAGEMGAAFVRGVQSKNVGACPKHFALNSQEGYRMICDSVADERAFYEIYTKAFRRVVQENPAMIMCSYNKIDGIYASQNKRLLDDVLRKEFGYPGVVVSDWTAVDERSQALKATLDLEMPGYVYSVHRLEKDFKAGKIAMDDLDASVRRILTLVESKAGNRIQDFDLSENHQLARKIAEGSLVLLKNEEKILPIRSGEKIAVFGALAREIRYQGGGSSHINPFKIDSLLDFIPAEADCVFAEGYLLTGDGYDETLLEEAKRMAIGKDKAIVVIGLTDVYESEGFDRRHMDLPRGHNALVEAVRSVNDHVAVVLQLGSPVLMPWKDDVQGILNAYLLGEAGAGALADILFGKVNPSGRLPETFPAALEETPCYGHFALGNGEIPYRESLYVGYRYYSSKGLKTLYPFGYGLSYTEFCYSDLSLDSDVLTVPGTVTVSVKVQNIGDVPGREVVQLYIQNNQDRQYKPLIELRKFQKVSLDPQETKTVVFTLTDADFAYFEPAVHGFVTDSGSYRIQIRKNAETLLLDLPVRIVNETHKNYAMNYMKAASYRVDGGLSFSSEDFESLIGRKVGPGHVKSRRPFTLNSNFEDLSATKLGAFLAKKAVELGTSRVKDADETYRRMVEQSLLETPLRSTVLFSGGLVKMHQMRAAVELCNGRFFKALGWLFRRD
jgi:beta-glucosidase